MPTITSIFSDEILKQADDLRLAEGRYEGAFDRWSQSVPTLDTEHFWREIDRIRSIWSERDSNDSEWTADEYLRQAAVEGEERLAAAVHFCVSYRRYVESLRSRCEHITDGWERGDDGFGDLMDSLPMAGESVYVRVKGGDFWDEDGDDTVNLDDLESSVKSAAPKVAERIINGENYWASTLEKAAQDRLKFVLCFRG